jgi:hypothetical protein
MGYRVRQREITAGEQMRTALAHARERRELHLGIANDISSEQPMTDDGHRLECKRVAW